MPAKVLKDFLQNEFEEKGFQNNEVKIMTVAAVGKVIKEQKLRPNEFDEIVFDELNSTGPTIVQIFEFFLGFKWGLSTVASEAILSLFKRTATNIDFDLLYNVSTKQFTYNNIPSESNYLEILIDTIKSSLSKISTE